MALLLKHQTPQELIARIREFYRNNERAQLVRVARFILARIQSADITDAQCRSAFGLTVTQWNNLKSRMQALVTASNTIKSAVGE